MPVASGERLIAKVQQNLIRAALNLSQMVDIELVSLRMRMWGRDLGFECKAGIVRFDLRFLDCRETRWQLYTHLKDEKNPAFPPTELVNFKMGRSEHRSPAHILTEHFGVSLVYGELQLIQEGVVIPLGTE